jgi:assimilatory nitrate reductase catalytic subunit
MYGALIRVTLPGKGVSAYEMMEKVHEQEIRALFVMGSNPLVSNPNANFVEEGLKKLDFLVVADFLISETAQLADLILPVTAYLENAGTLTNLEGRVLLREAGRAAPGEAKHDWQVLCELAERLGRGQFFPFAQVEDIFNELRLASRGGTADYYGITYDRLRKEEGIYWPCPEEGIQVRNAYSNPHFRFQREERFSLPWRIICLRNRPVRISRCI